MGVIPGMESDWSGASAGTGFAGRGSTALTGASAGCCPSRSFRPTRPTAREAPRKLPLARRNRRRSQSGMVPVAGDFAGAMPSRGGRRQIRNRSVPRPAATATATLANAAMGDARAAKIAAIRPISPKPTKAVIAVWKLRRAAIPTHAATSSAATTMMMFSAALSLVPKRLVNRSLAPAGCSAITSEPIETTSDGTPGMSPASSSDAAIATAAAATPASAASVSRRRWGRTAVAESSVTSVGTCGASRTTASSSTVTAVCQFIAHGVCCAHGLAAPDERTLAR